RIGRRRSSQSAKGDGILEEVGPKKIKMGAEPTTTTKPRSHGWNWNQIHPDDCINRANQIREIGSAQVVQTVNFLDGPGQDQRTISVLIGGGIFVRTITNAAV